MSRPTIQTESEENEKIKAEIWPSRNPDARIDAAGAEEIQRLAEEAKSQKMNEALDALMKSRQEKVAQDMGFVTKSDLEELSKKQDELIKLMADRITEQDEKLGKKARIGRFPAPTEQKEPSAADRLKKLWGEEGKYIG